MLDAQQLGGNPVHYPSNPELFQFDDEVSSIFDNMARRAIPMYDTVHKLHGAILLDHWRHARRHASQYRVIDVGSSTGRFFKELCNQLQLPLHVAPHGIVSFAVDPSVGMMKQLEENVPWVVPFNKGLLDIPNYLYDSVDAINISYVLQFIPERDKRRALATLAKLLKPGGLLLMAQKDDVLYEPFGATMYEQYDTFKLNNGYTRQEIDAKTDALRNAMWPTPHGTLVSWLEEAGFGDIVETTRWNCFSSLVARRL